MIANVPSLSCPSAQTVLEQTFSVRLTFSIRVFVPPRLAEMNDSLDVYPKCRTMRDVWLNNVRWERWRPPRPSGPSFLLRGSHRPKERRSIYRNELDVSSGGERPGIRWVDALCLDILAAVAGSEKERCAANLECESAAGNWSQLSDFLGSRARIVHPGGAREVFPFGSAQAPVG